MRKVFFILLLLFASLVSFGQSYEKTLRDIRHAFDTNTHSGLYEKYWKAYDAKPTAETAFAAAAVRFFWLRLVALGYKEVPKSHYTNEPERGALLYAMKHEKKSAYPIMLYSALITSSGEPSLPPPPRKFVKMIEERDASGKVVRRIPLYRLAERYPALEKRLDELLAKAAQLEPNNPLVLINQAKRPLRENPKDAKAVEALASYRDTARDMPWEFQLLYGLYMSRKDGNKGVPNDLDRSIAEALTRAKSGPYAKVYAFLAK